MLELSATYPLLTCVFACNIHQPYICWSKVLPFGTPAWSQRFARTPEIAKELTMPLWRTWNPCSVPTVRISWVMNCLNYCFTIFWWFLVQATTVCVVSSLRLVALFMNVVEQKGVNYKWGVCLRHPRHSQTARNPSPAEQALLLRFFFHAF